MSVEQIKEEISKTKAAIDEYLSMDISTEHLEEHLRYLEKLLEKKNLEKAKPEEIKGDALFRKEEMGIKIWPDPTLDHICLKLTIETAEQLYRAMRETIPVCSFMTHEENK